MGVLASLLLAFVEASRQRGAADALARHLNADCIDLLVPDAPGEEPTPAFPERCSGHPHAVSVAGPDGTMLRAAGPRVRTRRLKALAGVLPLAGELVRAERDRRRLRADVVRLAEEAARAARATDEFLATLSHEVRMPLNVALGWTQLLRLHIDTPAIRDHAIDVIERNARAQAQIVSDLVDISRLVTGNLHVECAPIDLREVAALAIDAAESSAAAKGIRIVRRLEAPARVAGDAARLRQVIGNLLSNAVKFTPAGGTVTVTLVCAGNVAEITVADTGVGIAPDFLPHVFERFRQRDMTLTRPYGGLGLGLALVRHLAGLHGGTVRAESAGEGQGASFTISIPLHPAQPANDEDVATIARRT